MTIAQYLNPSLADDPQECPAWYQSGRALKKKKKKRVLVSFPRFAGLETPYTATKVRGARPPW